MAKSTEINAIRLVKKAEAYTRRLRQLNTVVLPNGAEQRIEELANIVENLTRLVRDLAAK